MTLALIDGDEAIFKACAVQTADVDWDSGTVTDRPPTFAEARGSLAAMLENWTAAAGADEFIVCLSPRDRRLFRRGLFPDYKGERGEKPAHFWELDEWVRATYECRDAPGLEADDVMGVSSGDGRIIVSSDKDLKTVPGPLYNPRTGAKGVISPVRADWQWMFQTLTGDSTDGFSGCIGIGPKKAEDILAGATSIDGWWPLVCDAFAAPKKGKYRDIQQTREDAALQARLARILRPGDYCWDTGRVTYRLGRSTVTFNANTHAA